MNRKQAQLNRLQLVLEKCQDCNLCKNRNKVVLGQGDPYSKVLLLGEGPGFFEDKIGLPFVGNSGYILDTVLELLEIKRKDIYISNIIHCRAFWTGTNKDRPPNEIEITACKKYTNNIIQIINPKIIITLGNIPLKFFFPNSLGITKLAVHGIWKKWNNIDILPLYHPSFVKRNGGINSQKGKEFLEDFKKMKDKWKLEENI